MKIRVEGGDDMDCLHCAVMDAIEEFAEIHGTLQVPEIVEALIAAIIDIRKGAPSQDQLREMDDFIVAELEAGGLSLMQVSGRA